MSHPYDASTKYLLNTWLADWLPLSGRTTTAKLEVISADLSTVTAAADSVLRVWEDPPWLLHMELQSSRDPDLHFNLPAYNILLSRQYRMPVRTVIVLLRSAADSPEMTGTVRQGFAGAPPYLMFQYDVVRLWQLSPETFLSGGLGIVPLAPLSAVTKADLPGLVRRMDTRIRAEARPDDAGKLWTAADVLMGLRYPSELISQLLQGVQGMKESVTYQAIVEEGVAKGMVRARHEDLILFGRGRFGEPKAETVTALHSITDAERLARMVHAMGDASSWEELLATL